MSPVLASFCEVTWDATSGEEGHISFIERADGPDLRFSHVDAILLVFAEQLENVVIGHQVVRDLNAKGFGVYLGVVKGHFDIQVPEVAAVKPFCEAQRLAMRVPHSLEGGLIVEFGGLNHGPVALPLPNSRTPIGPKG